MSQDTNVKELVINQLTKAQYNNLVNSGTLSNTELYVITDDAHYTSTEILGLLKTKQDKLTAEGKINISSNNVITVDLSDYLKSTQDLFSIDNNNNLLSQKKYLISDNINISPSIDTSVTSQYIILDDKLYAFIDDTLESCNINAKVKQVSGGCDFVDQYGIVLFDDNTIHLVKGLNIYTSTTSGTFIKICGCVSTVDNIVGFGISENGALYSIYCSGKNISITQIGTSTNWTHISGYAWNNTTNAYGICDGQLYELKNNNNVYVAEKIDNDNNWTDISGWSSSDVYAMGIKNGNIYLIKEGACTKINIEGDFTNAKLGGSCDSYGYGWFLKDNILYRINIASGLSIYTYTTKVFDFSYNLNNRKSQDALIIGNTSLPTSQNNDRFLYSTSFPIRKGDEISPLSNCKFAYRISNSTLNDKIVGISFFGTPFYSKDDIDSKLDKVGVKLDYDNSLLTLYSKDGTALSSVTIETSATNVDNISIKRNNDDNLECIGEITKNNIPKYTWIGTQEEYEQAITDNIIDTYTEVLITNSEVETVTPTVSFNAPTKLSELANDTNFVDTNTVNNIKTELQNKIDLKANDANVVHKDGNEVIDGFKTFKNEIVIQNGETKTRIAHKNSASNTPNLQDGYIEFGDNTLVYGKQDIQGNAYDTRNNILHSGNLIGGNNIEINGYNDSYVIDANLSNYYDKNETDNLLRSKLFDVVQKDHILTFEESKGLVAFGDYAYKTGVSGSRYGYPDFYSKCLEEYNNSTDYQITGKRRIESLVTGDNDRTLCTIHSKNGEKYALNFQEGNSFNAKGFDLPLSTSGLIPTGNGNCEFYFTTGDDVTTQQVLVYSLFHFYIGIKSGKMHYYVSTNGTSWNAANGVAGSQTISTNTTYKLTFYVSGLNSISITSKINDSSDYNYSNANSNHAKSTVWEFGTYASSSTANYTYPFLGKINLTSMKDPNNITNESMRAYEVINCKKHNAGHIFYDNTDESKIDELYASTGMAWFYGIDTTNERIRMPRNDKYFMCGTDAGAMIQAGLPNVVGATQNTSGTSNNTGAFKYDKTVKGNGGEGKDAYVSFDASRVSSIYGNSDTVQTDAVKLMGYICVGNTETEVASTEVIDVTTTENDTIPLFTGMYFDFKPNNISWLKANTVQPKSGTIYETAYNELVKCLNEVDNIYNIKVVDVADMVEGVDYSLYWKVDQVNMTFTTPSKWGLVSALTGTQRVLVAKKEPTTIDPTWYNLYSDGWLEQGGICNSQSYNEDNQQVTFFIPYKDTSYTALTSAGPTTQGSWQIATRIAIKTTTGLDIRGGSNANAEYKGACAWQATGYTEIPNVEDYTEDVYLYFKVGNAVQNAEIINVAKLTEAVNNKIDINSKYVDGQWVAKTQVLSQATTTGVISMDLSSYLPNDNYNYEVLIICSFADNGANYMRVYSDIIPQSTTVALITTGNGYYNGSYIAIPVGSGRAIYRWANAELSTDTYSGIEALAYRRIGTNG